MFPKPGSALFRYYRWCKGEKYSQEDMTSKQLRCLLSVLSAPNQTVWLLLLNPVRAQVATMGSCWLPYFLAAWSQAGASWHSGGFRTSMQWSHLLLSLDPLCQWRGFIIPLPIRGRGAGDIPGCGGACAGPCHRQVGSSRARRPQLASIYPEWSSGQPWAWGRSPLCWDSTQTAHCVRDIWTTLHASP